MNNISNIDGTAENITPISDAEFNRLLNSINATLKNYLERTLHKAFEALDDNLFELANAARTNNEQSRYFDAMRETRLKRRSVIEYACSAIPIFTAEPKRAELLLSDGRKQDNLSLVEHHELEDQVVIESMANNLTITFTGELLLCQQRIHSLYQSNNNKSITITIVDPHVICRIINQSLNTLDIERKEKQLLLKEADKQLQSTYQEPLEGINELLVKAGVLPSLKFKSITTKESANTHETSEETEPKDSPQDTFQELKSLLNKTRPAGQVHHLQSAQPNRSTRQIGETELFNALNTIQQSQSQESLIDRKAVLIDLKSAINDTINIAADSKGSPRENHTINQDSEDAINLVSMLFEFILDDYNLSAPIQVLISRLQIPTLKIVLKDPSFFSKPSHPARKLLNALAKAGIGWSDESERSKDKLYDQIHTIVRRILEENTPELSLYQQLHDDFQTFLNRESKRSAIIEERTKEAEIGRIRTQKAQNMVKSTIKNIVGQHSLPDVAAEILENGWSRVMFIAYLKDHKENRWEESVKIAENLVWCLTPLTHPDDRERWTRTAPQCVKALKKGLQEISYNASDLDDKISLLKKTLADTFKNPESLSTTQPKVTPISKAQSQPKPDDLTSENPRQLTVINNLSVGDWIEFSLVNGSPFRCKLSAKIDDPDCYIFVNRLGLKVIEKTRSELAKDLTLGKLAILEQGLLVDRALNAVVGNLRKISGMQA